MDTEKSIIQSPVIRITLIVLVPFIVINNLLFFPGNILSWDVFGYYLYLPCKFIYHDLGMQDISVINAIIEKYSNTGTLYQAMIMPDGHYTMKYSMGMAIGYTPFFFIGHLFANLLHYPTDGFSLPYQYAVFFGSILYTIAGIIFLAKVLMHFFSEKIAAMVLCIIVFGTNYLMHNTMYGQNAMPHNYLFTNYAIILWLTIRWHDSHKFKHLLFLAIICGLSVLSRPSEIVCLIIPAIWGIRNRTTLIEKFKLLYQYKVQLIVFILVLGLFGSFQFIYWKIFTGKFLFYSYGLNAGEGFEFKHPFIAEVLFSFRKGWLIYTPVMLFAIVGLFIMYRGNRPVFYAFLLYFIVNLYIVSSWSCWWYAQSFSQRALIPSLPVMAIGIGYFITWLTGQKQIIRYSGFVATGLCVCLNLFQTAQFHYGILSGDRMTKAYYFKIFGKMKVSEEDKKLLLVSRSFDLTENFTNENEYDSQVIFRQNFQNHQDNNSTDTSTLSGSYQLDSALVFTPAFQMPYKKITMKDHAWIRVTAMIYPTSDVTQNPFSLIIHFIHNNFTYKYTNYDADKMNLQLNQWNKISFDYLTPEVRRTSDILKMYFWNRGNGSFYVKDMMVQKYEKK